MSHPQTERRAAIFYYVLAICAVAAVVIAFLWVGHYLFFDLVPSPHEFEHHAPGQLGRDYPLGWLRGLAMVIIVAGVVSAALAAIMNPTGVTLAVAATILVAMATSGIVQSSGSSTSTTHDPVPVQPPPSARISCSDGTQPTMDGYGQLSCNDVNAFLECPGGLRPLEDQGSDPGFTLYSCDGRVVSKGP